jgi:hypothetical protein
MSLSRRQNRKQMQLLSDKQIKDLELEKDFQARVIHLARINGWRVYHVPDSRRATMAGFPDLTLWHVRMQRLAFAELKRENGRLSDAQEEVLAELREVSKAIPFEIYFWKPSDWDDIEAVLGRNSGRPPTK